MSGELDPGDRSNPYAPPAAAGAQWDPAFDATAPAPVATAVPKVFGVLSIVFGSLMLLGGLIGACTGCVGQGFTGMGSKFPSARGQQQEMVRVMMKHMGTIYAAMGVQSLVFAVMSGWLLAIGIGQVRYRRWACRWAVYWGSTAIVVLLGMIVVSVLWIGPAYSAMFTEISRVAPSGAMPASFGSSLSGLFGSGSGVLTTIFYGPYPILMLVYFTRDRVRNAMNT